MEIERKTVRIDKETNDKLKHILIDKNINFNKLINNYIKEFIEENGGK